MEHLGFSLRHIYFNRLDGELTATYGRKIKNLYFKRGDLVFAKTNQQGERLGEILFKLGKISEETFLKIESYLESRISLGQILLKRGLISEKNLREGLIYQMKEITLNLFNVFEASINFIDKKPFSSPLGEEIRIPAPQLIEDGIRLMKMHPNLICFLENKIPFLKSKSFLHVLTDEERQLLAKIKGKATAKALFKTSGLGADYFWRTLYLFYCLDLVDFEGEAESWQVQAEVEEQQPEIFNEVLEFQARLASLNYYEVLGISRSASPEEAKKAYFQLARRFHPDRFGRDVPASLRDKVNEVFDQLTKIYKTLSNNDSRRVYDLVLAGGVKQEEKSVGAKANLRFRQARTLFNQGRYDDAIILLEESVRLVPNKAEYWLLLAMAESKVPALRRKAELDFHRVQELEPWNPEGYVGLGLLYKQEGLLVKASKQWQQALQIDPDHKTAREELELVKGKKKEKKDLFSLFKKK